ncbi:MAG: M20/M25/M40 family metallo-hydrolase [Phycisphaeraceae bacterium]|nr:M20/M25/M40 family metallo-hydrolase [Phycisphaeraceae bacterium]
MSVSCPSIDTLRPSDVVEVLQTMVRTPTVNRPGNVNDGHWPEEELSGLMQALAESWGLRTLRLAVPGRGENLLITIEAGSGLPWILFDSHLDTVSEAGMVVSPFGGEIKDGRMFGRGTSDTKGTGAAMMCAMGLMAKENPPEDRNVGLLLSVDEELGMRGIGRFVTHDLETLGGPVVGVIVGEPTALYPLVAHHGSVRYELVTQGVAAHSSMPDLGKSAISLMCRFVTAIEAEYRPMMERPHPLAGPPACSVNQIRGGDQPNIIPVQCRASVDRRLTCHADPEQAESELRQVLSDVANRVAGVSGMAEQWRLERVSSYPGLDDRTGETWQRAVLGVLETLGHEARRLGAPFCTHAGAFSQAGVPAVVLGPGDPWAAHREDESIPLDQLAPAVEVYRRLAGIRIDPLI